MENKTNQKTLESKGLLMDLFSQRIQLELLFSTGAVVSLMSLPDIVFMRLWLISERSSMDLLIFFQLATQFIASGINALIIGFSFNILFRVLTLCFVGLDYVFPKGVVNERLGYHPEIEKHITNRILSQKWIEKFEKLASFFFSTSILMVFNFLGICLLFYSLYILTRILGFDFMTADNKNSNTIFSIMFGLSILISLGLPEYLFFVLFKKIPIVGKIYIPFYWIFNVLSLNFLIKRQRLILNSNLGRFKTALLIIAFLFVGLFTTKAVMKNILYTYDKRSMRDLNTLGKYRIIDSFFDDERKENVPVLYASLPSRYIKSTMLPVFVCYHAYMDSDLREIYQPQTVFSDSLTQDMESVNRLKAVGKFYSICIDTIQQDSLQWFHGKHTQTQETGFFTFIPIDDLKNGVHQLKLKLNFSKNNKYIDKNTPQELFINFVKDEKN